MSAALSNLYATRFLLHATSEQSLAFFHPSNQAIRNSMCRCSDDNTSNLLLPVRLLSGHVHAIALLVNYGESLLTVLLSIPASACGLAISPWADGGEVTISPRSR